MPLHAPTGASFWRKPLLAFGMALLGVATKAQSDGQVYRILEVGGQQTLSGYLTCWLDLLPGSGRLGPHRRMPLDAAEQQRWRAVLVELDQKRIDPPAKRCYQ